MVREALQERETLLRMMPHISWPLRFVLPVTPGLRYARDTSSLGRVLAIFRPCRQTAGLADADRPVRL